MICPGCKFDLRCVTMHADWRDHPSGSRELSIWVICPQCGNCYGTVPNSVFAPNSFIQLTAPPDG